MSGPIIITVPNFIKYEELSEKNNDSNIRAKKRRLNLSWEEKIQRKKLKNRVAAQTSRDRKKAKMEELVAEVNTLKAECERLRLQNEKLEYENMILHRNASRDDKSTAIVGSELLKGPAVSTLSPLPQEGASELAVVADVQTKNQTRLNQTLCSILAVLICQTSCESSNLKNVLKILPKTSYLEPSLMTTLRACRASKLPKLKWSAQHGMHQNGWNLQL